MLKKRIHDFIKKFNEEIENIEKKPSEVKNIITVMKNTLKEINSRLGFRVINQQFKRQDSRKHPIRTTEGKKSKTRA